MTALLALSRAIDALLRIVAHAGAWFFIACIITMFLVEALILFIGVGETTQPLLAWQKYAFGCIIL